MCLSKRFIYFHASLFNFFPIYILCGLLSPCLIENLSCVKMDTYLFIFFIILKAADQVSKNISKKIPSVLHSLLLLI